MVKIPRIQANTHPFLHVRSKRSSQSTLSEFANMPQSCGHSANLVWVQQLPLMLEIIKPPKNQFRKSIQCQCLVVLIKNVHSACFKLAFFSFVQRLDSFEQKVHMDSHLKKLPYWFSNLQCLMVGYALLFFLKQKKRGGEGQRVLDPSCQRLNNCSQGYKRNHVAYPIPFHSFRKNIFF